MRVGVFAPRAPLGVTCGAFGAVQMKSGASSDSGGEGGAGAPVGRLVDCSQADDRRMIALVRERRLLYARNNMPVASYYSQVKRLWQEVAREMGWTVAEVRRKWSHIRNSYSRHLRNEMHGVRTGRGRMVSRWYLADELAFLREHMATDTRPCRYSYAPLYVEPCLEGAGDVGDAGGAGGAGDLQPFMSRTWFALSQAARAPPAHALVKAEPASADEATGAPSAEADDPPSFGADENAAYFQFFRGIHDDYRELPARKQRQFRRECLAALHRLLDDEPEPLGLHGPPDADESDQILPN